MRGIRVRITALATLVVVVVLAVAAVALLTSQRRLLVDDLDDALRAGSKEVVAAVRNGNLDRPLTVPGDDDSIGQVVDTDGRVLAASTNFADRPAFPPPSGDPDETFRSSDVLPGEPEYRVMSRRVGGVVVHTGAPLDDVEESLAALRLGLWVAIPSVAIVLAGLIWWLVGRTLRPVESIRREVADISGHDMHRRVPEPATDDEIARLARTMNAMLDRLQASADRQQHFVADASHELRSPLTRIRTELEVDLRDPDDADLVATHRSVLEEAEHLQRLVDDLLILARIDAGPEGDRQSVTVDLDDIALRETARLRDATPIRIDTSGIGAAQVAGDPDQLTRVVRNLTDNAVRHAKTAVVVTLTEDSGLAKLTVDDDGPGIPPDQRERVFQRFTRLDEARTDTDGGTGLGLAIAREIATRHGGTIVVDPGRSVGTRFVVELPLVTPGT